jgi:hypothetical protein
MQLIKENYLELTPAYGRDYADAKAAKQSFMAGQDWRISPAPFPLEAKLVRELESLGRMLLQFYRDGAALRGFETGVQYALARILVDPRFVYRFEQEPAGLAPGTA